jgi:hypothetical protein
MLVFILPVLLAALGSDDTPEQVRGELRILPKKARDDGVVPHDVIFRGIIDFT